MEWWSSGSGEEKKGRMEILFKVKMWREEYNLNTLKEHMYPETNKTGNVEEIWGNVLKLYTENTITYWSILKGSRKWKKSKQEIKNKPSKIVRNENEILNECRNSIERNFKVQT